MAEHDRAPLFRTGEIRTAFIATAVGMVGVLVVILLLATSRPQGDYQAADDEQFEATLAAAAENLQGYELVGESRARIDIAHAIELVVERGVDLSITEIGVEPDVTATAPAGAAGEEPAEDGAPAADAAVADGAAVYAANCAACHQGSGQGIPGAFPPLAGNLPDILAAEGGRAYLIRALLYGVQGPIDVNGQTYNGVMPAWPQLSNAELAGVLNHALTAWGNEFPSGAEPFAPDEFEAARGEELTASAVNETRPEIP